MTSDQRVSYDRGDTRATMAATTGSKGASRSKSLNRCLSSDCGLQLARMKPESLVTAHQPWRGEYVLEPCTRDAWPSQMDVGSNPTGRRQGDRSEPAARLREESREGW